MSKQQLILYEMYIFVTPNTGPQKLTNYEYQLIIAAFVKICT